MHDLKSRERGMFTRASLTEHLARVSFFSETTRRRREFKSHFPFPSSTRCSNFKLLWFSGWDNFLRTSYRLDVPYSFETWSLCLPGVRLIINRSFIHWSRLDHWGFWVWFDVFDFSFFVSLSAHIDVWAWCWTEESITRNSCKKRKE